MKTIKALLILVLVSFCFGCAALEVAMENKDLQVISSLNDVPFFDAQPGEKVYVQVKNFSEYPDLNSLTDIVKNKYRERGFVIVDNMNQADWVVRAKIVNIKKEDLSARQVKGGSSFQAGAGGAGLGALTGAATGGDLRSVAAGALIGGVLTGTANLTVNSWVKLGYLTIVTDIQVRERSDVATEITSTQRQGNTVKTATSLKESQWLDYKFQAITRGQKVDLDWNECKDKMIAEISRILGSLL